MGGTEPTKRATPLKGQLLTCSVETEIWVCVFGVGTAKMWFEIETNRRSVNLRGP